MDKVLVLGINGFTGQHFDNYIIKNALNNKFEFVGVDKEINRDFSIRCVKTDLLQADSISDLIEKESPVYVINLVGTFQSKIFDTFLAINAGITQKLFEAILKGKMNVRKLLLIGSAAEYGIPSTLPIKEETPLHPLNWYGLSKVIQTNYAQFYVRNYDLPVIIARTFNIIGRGISPALSIGGFIERIAKANEGEVIEVGNIETKRDFLDIEDVLDAYWKLLIKGKSGEIYNVCRGESHYTKDLLDYLIKMAKKSLKININKGFFKSNDILDIYGDNSKIVNETSWKPKISIFDALTRCYPP